MIRFDFYNTARGLKGEDKNVLITLLCALYEHISELEEDVLKIKGDKIFPPSKFGDIFIGYEADLLKLEDGRLRRLTHEELYELLQAAKRTPKLTDSDVG